MQKSMGCRAVRNTAAAQCPVWRRATNERANLQHSGVRFVLQALAMSFIVGSTAVDGFAGFLAYSVSDVQTSTGPGDRDVDENWTDLAGSEASVSEFSLIASARAFASVVPRQPGASLASPYAEFRHSATAGLKRNFQTTNFKEYAFASSYSEWHDVLHFEPISVAAARISAWGVYLDLNGELKNHVTSEVPDAHGGYSTVTFAAEWGGDQDSLSFEQYDSGSKPFVHERSRIIRSQRDPFAAEGIALRAYLLTQAVVGYHFHYGLEGGVGTAAANFGHTGDFPGVFALDADGNILPDAANWVRVTSDSGAEFRILSEFPRVSAVPEPSTFVMLGVGSLFVLVRRRRRKRLAQPDFDRAAASASYGG